MALINCPECGASVSSSADECPKCAYPISGGGSRQETGSKIQTIQLTSKSYKLQQFLSALLFIASFIIMFNNFRLGITVMIIAMIWGIITRILIWWHHE